MAKQFRRSYVYFEQQGLNPTESVIMTHLFDRMESSIHHQKYFDQQQQAFFVIYTCDQLAAEINVTSKTVGRAFNRLEKKGWLKRTVIKGVNYRRIFLPKYTPAAFPYFLSIQTKDKMSGTHWTICPLNQTLIIQTNYQSIKTIKTAPSEFLTHDRPKTSRTEHPSAHYSPQTTLDLWKATTVTKLGFPAMAVEQIAQFAHNEVPTAKAIVKKIMIARGAIVKENHLKRGPVTQFESNGNIQSRLAGTLSRIFSYIKQKGYQTYDGYLVNACKKFFKAALGLVPEGPTVTPVMPRAGRRKKAIKETLPDWAQAGYVAPQAVQATPAEKQQVNQELAQITLHKIMLANPNYLKQFVGQSSTEIQRQLKQDMSEVKPAVFTQALKLVQANLGKTTITPGETPTDTISHPLIKQPTRPLLADQAEVAQVNRELAQLAVKKLLHQEPHYLAGFQATDTASIEQKLVKDLKQPHPAVLKQAVRQIQARLTTNPQWA
ncbi:hypothetical protein [Lentilactobacillus hilgardii]|uniref:hypothetical protein n=1 Tax=Lentilactobacillus hilgardii TaxID=1588 RepID=UPI0021A582F3|nr:hypothetical protein [Lentilactobacillus hilgardii]MCT3397100.1 hypothetical protein [Lentilactobacillus hilgardii]